jgi:hypothetical protein
MPKDKNRSLEDMHKEMVKKIQFEKRLHGAVILSESFNENGVYHTIQITVSASIEDSRLDDVLCLIPSMAAISEFMKRIPSYEVDEKMFDAALKSGNFI